VTKLRWTHEQFEEMSWHDNHVHGLRILEGAHGAGELLLDLDYILEWLKGPDEMQFRLVPVSLRFTEVTNLRVSLDYASASAALGPFSVHAIERHLVQRERYVAQVWRIRINWPGGEISFEANGYEQRSKGEAVVRPRQYLLPKERNAA